MKQLSDLYKNNNPNIIDAEKLFVNGQLDEEYFTILINELKLLPEVKRTPRIKYFMIKENRARYESFPDRLPTNNLTPYPIDAHEHIGEYENNHTIYLTIANAYNKAMEKIEILEARITDLENK
jgi:hypothetical protein